jgi:hypothetical protein
MSYLEFLTNGSDFHVASPGTHSFAILPADQHSEEGRQRFHEIVEEAIRNAPVEGYEVTLLQKGNRDSKDWWDRAVIIVR